MNKIYPPIIENTLPAFWGTTLVVPYSMNKAVSINDFDNFKIKIKSAQTNEVYSSFNPIYDKTNSKLGEAHFIISQKEEKIGHYFKIQLAYSKNGIEGIYSEAGIAKYTGEPVVTLEQLSGNSYIYQGKYSNKDQTEKIYSYCFDLYCNKELLETSDWQLYNNLLNENTLFELQEDLELGNNYEIEYKIKTINNLIVSSGLQKIDIKPSLDSEYKIEIIPILNYDNGYISVSFNSSDVLTGDFIVSRSDSTTNFKEWKDIYNLKFKRDSLKSFSFKDFNIKHGESYKYSIRQINKYNVVSNRQISFPIQAYFEDIFLFDGEKQLKLRFNPKVASFKNYISESKIETIGGQYPFYFRNTAIKYKDFPIAGLISQMEDEEQLFIKSDLAFTDLTDNNLKIEREFKLIVLDWLTDGKPKLFKSPTEGNYIIRLSNVSLTPVDALGRMIHSFTANAQEIAEYNYDSMKNLKLLKVKEYSPNLLSWTQSILNNETFLINENIYHLHLENLSKTEIVIMIDNISIVLAPNEVFIKSYLDNPIQKLELITKEAELFVIYGHQKNNNSQFNSIVSVRGEDNIVANYSGPIEDIAVLLNDKYTKVNFLRSAIFTIKTELESEDYKAYEVSFDDNKVNINLKDLIGQSYYIENIRFEKLKIGANVKAEIKYYKNILELEE